MWSSLRHLKTRQTNITGPQCTVMHEAAVSPPNDPHRQRGFVRSGKCIIWSKASCPQKAHSDLLRSEGEIKGVIQRSPPTGCDKARGKSALRPRQARPGNELVCRSNTGTFHLMGAFCLTGLKQTKWRASRQQGIMGRLCCQAGANALTVNTSECFSPDSYEPHETKFVGY